MAQTNQVPIPNATAQQVSTKGRFGFFLLQFLFGFAGAGRFYSGHKKTAIAQLLLSVVSSIVLYSAIGPLAAWPLGWTWAFFDGVIVLIFGGNDANGNRLR